MIFRTYRRRDAACALVFGIEHQSSMPSRSVVLRCVCNSIFRDINQLDFFCASFGDFERKKKKSELLVNNKQSFAFASSIHNKQTNLKIHKQQSWSDLVEGFGCICRWDAATKNLRLTTSSPRPQSYVSSLTLTDEEMCVSVSPFTQTHFLSGYGGSLERKEVKNNGCLQRDLTRSLSPHRYPFSFIPPNSHFIIVKQQLI